jgi:inhibitor of cysteine peptidase
VLRFEESAAEQSAELAAGESFEISLRENPTTGYRWSLTAGGEAACVLSGDEFEPGQAPGAGGIHRWRFRAAQAGEVRIEFALKRRWAQADAPAKSFALRVKVNP